MHKLLLLPVMIVFCSSCKALKLIQGFVFLCLMWYSFLNKLFSCKFYIHLNVMFLRGNLGRRWQCQSPLLSAKHLHTSINTAALLLIWQIPSCHRLCQSFSRCHLSLLIRLLRIMTKLWLWVGAKQMKNRERVVFHFVYRTEAHTG